MTQKINVQSLPVFSLAEQLKTEEDISIYLGLVLEKGSSFELEHAANLAKKAREIFSLKMCKEKTFLDSKK
jgi:DNA-binding phage protein